MGLPEGGQATPLTTSLAHLKGVKEALELAELALAQRSHLRHQLLYRDILVFPETQQQTEEAGTDVWAGGQVEGRGHLQRRGKPSLELLWTWKCPLTEGLTATCLVWNKVRKDILAVGYGCSRFGPSGEGRLALWSLKNPGHPIWTCRTAAGVTSLDFSLHNGNVVAVGLYNGALLLFDAKARQETAMMASRSGSGGHGDPIWQVRWVDCGPERGEALTTISTDGRITRWSITQGLEPTDLMRLRRAPARKGVSAAVPGSGDSRRPSKAETSSAAGTTPAGGTAGGAESRRPSKAGASGPAAGLGAGARAESGGPAGRPGKTEALISRHSGGFCFDFAGQDGRMYLAGTEDGQIHKCSIAYSEQYLATHVGHMGPVYRVQWSPFCPNIFLSASADWTLNIWADGKDAALLSLTMGTEEVTDASWCPSMSTLLAATTSGGQIQLWDLATSTLRPATSYTLPGEGEEGGGERPRMECVAFSPAAPVVAAGDSRGGVSLFRLWGVDHVDPEGVKGGEEAQAAALSAALHATGAKVSVSADV